MDYGGHLAFVFEIVKFERKITAILAYVSECEMSRKNAFCKLFFQFIFFFSKLLVYLRKITEKYSTQI